jgi:uncharacterized protein (TIGR04255 family)
VSRHQQYDQQPLVEAVFELFTQPEAWTSWGAGSFAHIATALPEYAFHEEHIRDIGIRLQLVESSLQPTAHQPQERVRRWNATRQKAVQFGSHMCAHNVLSSAYTHFDDHKATIADVMRCFLDEAKPERLGWIGQRYINSINIPADDREVAKYFEIYPQLPASLAGGHRQLAVQIQTVEFKNGVAMVNLSLQKLDDVDATYLLDIYARSSGDVPADVDALLRWQADAHEAVWASFQLSVSEKSKKDLFKERPWGS